MICPSCGTGNRDEALFCKHCGAALRRAPSPAVGAGPAATPESPPTTAIPPPPAWHPKAWWHGIGVLAILATFLVFIDFATDAVVTWSLVGVLGVAFLAGGTMILRFLASSDRTDRRPALTGAALLVAAVLLLPVALALQSTATIAETFEVPFDASIRNLNLDATNEAGEVSVEFAEEPFLVRAEVVHVGGLLTSHFDGDVLVTNTTTGDTLSFRVSARGIPGFFFVGGHHIRVTIHRNVSVSLALQSTTGSLAIDLPPGVSVRGVTATVTTGGIAVTSHDAIYANGATVRLISTTGGVTLDLRQTLGPPGTVSVSAMSAAGRVTFVFRNGAGVGAEVRSSVPTGSVVFDPARYEGTEELLYSPSEEYYETAPLKFTVQLTSTTGSIQIG